MAPDVGRAHKVSPMRNELANRTAALADAHLIRLLTVDKGEYRQAATALAQHEADRRNLRVDATILPSPQPRPSFVASLRLSLRAIPRSVVLAASFGALPFAAVALLYLFRAGHLADRLLLTASAPGLLLGGLLTGNIDEGFDTPTRCVATLGLSWLFWSVLLRVACRLVSAVKGS